jgi:transcriptional regulator with XRE-family HTH domain
MRGKSPTRVDRLRKELLSDQEGAREYETQRLIAELGTQLERALKHKNLTQVALAKAAHMHQPDLNALLRGRAAHLPTLPTLARLCRGLGLPFTIDILPTGSIHFRAGDEQQGASEET